MLNQKSDRKLRFAAGSIEAQIEQLLDEQAAVQIDSQDDWDLRDRIDDLSRLYTDIMMNDDVHRTINVAQERIKWIKVHYPFEELSHFRIKDLQFIVDILSGADDGPDDYYESGGTDAYGSVQ